MNDDPTTCPGPDPTPGRAARGRLARAAHSLAASALRGLATGTGTAAGTWLVWWITHR
ncbi:hypothetical protein [Embleya sp. NPDC020886]|uniref:hypothetical protein n=1 Tax=Embleya sp. NPDC020886 TaxID=3363980 RepID=UPI0037B3FEB1